MIRLSFVLIVLSLSTARAEESTRTAWDTADVGHKGAWSVGLFNPLRYAMADGLEIEVHPVVFLTAPHATVRVAHTTGNDLRITGEYGLSVPTFGMRLTQGFLFPTWAEKKEQIGWFVVPSAGVAVSGGAANAAVWTARADLAVGIPVGANSATPQHSFLAPLDLLFAPQLTGYRAHLGGAYDLPLSARVRAHVELNLFHVGSDPDLVVNGRNVGPLRQLSRVLVTSHAGVDIALFERSRVGLGVYLANYDQGAVSVTADASGFAQVDRVRSWNIIPTIDFIWAGGP